jgi:hypothetical protein
MPRGGQPAVRRWPLCSLPIRRVRQGRVSRSNLSLVGAHDDRDFLDTPYGTVPIERGPTVRPDEQKVMRTIQELHLLLPLAQGVW